MQIPGSLFLKTLEDKKVYFFNGNPPNGIAKHYHICVTKTEEKIVAFVCCTSQEDTINRLLERKGIPSSTVVYISKNEYPFLTKDTFVNCNEVFTIPLDKFSDYYDSGNITSMGEISLNHYKQIVDGIIESPLVEEEIKEEIPPVE